MKLYLTPKTLKKIIKMLVLFILACILIYFSNTLSVNAQSIPSNCHFYDNRGSSQTYLLTIGGVDYWKPENSFTLTANSYGGLIICTLDTPLVKDNLYSLSMYVELEGTNAETKLSAKPNLGIGNSFEDARSSYINNTNTSLKYSSASANNISYIFIANTDASFLAIPFGSSATVTTTPKLTNLSVVSQGNANNLTQNDIQNIISNSNDELKNSIEKSNDELKEEIKDNFNSCTIGKNLFNIKYPFEITTFHIGYNEILDDKIAMQSAGDWTAYTLINVPVPKNTNLTFSTNIYNTGQVSSAITITDSNGNELAHTGSTDQYGQYVLNFNSPTDIIKIIFRPNYSENYETNYVEFINPQIEKGNVATSYEPYGEVCQNKFDEQLKQDQEQHKEQMEQDKQQHEEQMQQDKELQEVCNQYDKVNIQKQGMLLNVDGIEIQNSNWGITDYIKINEDTKIKTLEIYTGGSSASICFYNLNKEKISCTQDNTLTLNDYITIPNNANYVKLSISSQLNKPQFEICKNGNQALNDNLDDLNDSINNSDTNGANNEANNFFNDFESNDFGLSDIITLPLTTIESITSKSCTPLNLTLPFVNKTFQLPCMTTIYSKFEPFYSIYQTITFGVISYWVCVQIYAMVKGFKDPAKDEIEVMDL